MIKLGYKLMSEEHGPTDLVRNIRRAEQAGFEFAAISDHFSPWIEEQGHAPFAWTILGALANATQHIGLMTAVTCPIMRYHPAIHWPGLARHAGAPRAPIGSDRHHSGTARWDSDELPRRLLPP
jgi:G6PDH family F420-dependent oxidoreductase